MYAINFYMYSGGPIYSTLTSARTALADFKREDKEACRQRFGRAKVTATKDSYKIEFGANLYSAASISKV